MLGFTIESPGLLSLFQDHGRLGYQNEGMPIAGAMDQENMVIANKLVGKEKGAVLEMTYLGCNIIFDKEMSIAITGADMTPCINGNPIMNYRTLRVKKGDLLTFKGLKEGFRGYIAFSDELVLEEVYGSKSTYLKAEIGGYKGRKLMAGDQVFVISKQEPPIYQGASPKRTDEIRVILGYEMETFVDTSRLFDKAYTVGKELDRMGIRLNGEGLKHKESADIISSPIVPGAIQVPQNGQPMVMLRDAQTIGGYTRIGTVISCDLDKLAQKKPGDQVRFVPISLEEAIEVKRQWLEKMIHMDLNHESRVFNVKVNNQVYHVVVEEIE